MRGKFLDQLLGEAEKRGESKKEEKPAQPIPIAEESEFEKKLKEQEAKLKKVIQKQSEIIASIYRKNKSLVLDVLDELEVSLEELKEVMEGLKIEI